MLFTVGFPYGDYESTFLPQEIAILSLHFKKIYLVPLRVPAIRKSAPLPSNVIVLNVDQRNHPRSFKDYVYISLMFGRELMLSGNPRLLNNFKYHISELFIYLGQAKTIRAVLEQNKLEQKNVLFYTYWFDEWASALTILKEKYLKHIKIVTRAHGFDLYENRNEKGYIFPRFLQMKAVEKVFPISANGVNHLSSLFPRSKNKIEVSRLGVKTPLNMPAPESKKDVITVVSCSAVIALKRVGLIAEILMHAKKHIHWIHFGAGPLYEDVRKASLLLPGNVKVELKGNVENEFINNFYAISRVDWFINVSEYEGIPVSIMEAIRYGIPAIAPDIGGVKEIVNSTTGFLISKDFNPAEVMTLIENNAFDPEKRKDIRNFWKENYSAERNFLDFAQKLMLA